MKSVRFACRWYVPFLFSFVLFIPTGSFSQNSSSSGASFTSIKSNAWPLKMNEVKRNAARHFRNNFSNAGNETWFKIDNSYVASFFDGKIRGKVYYNARGAFAYCVKYYGAGLLDPGTRLAIMKKFESYKIDAVTEISNLEEKLYFIKIKNSTNIKTLKVLNDSIEVTEDIINIGI